MRPVWVFNSPVNVNEVVKKAIAREAVAPENVEITLDETLRVMADPDYLFRSVSNLLRNSVRYAGSYGTILVSATAESGKILITVADEGPGLPEDALEDVFTPFHRPEAARSRETGGTGLGLAIVKSCIEACQGTVSCRNRMPRGLAVDIRLNGAVES